MTAPVGAVDHALEAARGIIAAHDMLGKACECEWANCDVAQALIDLDARLNAATDALAEVLDVASGAKSVTDKRWTLEQIRAVAADAIDAAHGGMA